MKLSKYFYGISVLFLFVISGCASESFNNQWLFGVNSTQPRKQMSEIDWSNTSSEMVHGVAIYKNEIREYTSASKVFMPPGECKVIIQWLRRTTIDDENTNVMSNNSVEQVVNLNLKPGIRYTLDRKHFAMVEKVTVDEDSIETK